MKQNFITVLMMLMALGSSAWARAEEIILPDGSRFTSWERPLTFTRTYYVDCNHTQASDENPGTKEKPWKTIGQAAKTLMPGQRVIIHAGVYREWVKPQRGGTGPDNMISYEAAPGERVVIKGSDIWKPKWQLMSINCFGSGPDVNKVIWEARLDGKMFEASNPFCLPNLKAINPWDKGLDAAELNTYRLTRGQVFVDGKPLTQMFPTTRYHAFAYNHYKPGEGRFMVSFNGETLYVVFPGRAKPDKQVVEITTRPQVFAPLKRHLNYIRVKGLIMQHAGNGIPITAPQRGLLSANGGHHWIIEDCEIGHANTLGADVGGGFWNLPAGKKQGYHIIRRNWFHHCGVSALVAWHNIPNEHLLVEDNLFTDNAWMPIIRHWESAAVKLHHTENSIIRRNVFLRTGHCASLWLDGEMFNTRITQNLFHGLKASKYFGHIFFEATYGPNMIDNNIILDSAKIGIYAHDTERLVMVQNLIANGRGSAIYMRHGEGTLEKGRMLMPWKSDNPIVENEHRVAGNIIADWAGEYIHFPNRTSKSDYNLCSPRNNSPMLFCDLAPGGSAKGGWASPEKMLNGAWKRLTWKQWRESGQDKHSWKSSVAVEFCPETLTLKLKAPQLAKLPSTRLRKGLIAPFVIVPEKWKPTLHSKKGWISDKTAPPPHIGPVEKLFTVDLLGRNRPKGVFQVGPLVNPPLDGTPINIDPRKKKK